MGLIVQKFGGSSVRDRERLLRAMRIVRRTWEQGDDVVVVLSAQGDTTDDLIAKAQEINPMASKREMDVLLSTGEQQSVALMSMALKDKSQRGEFIQGTYRSSAAILGIAFITNIYGNSGMAPLMSLS